MPSARMSILGAQSSTECFTPLSFCLVRHDQGLGRATNHGEAGSLRHFLTQPPFLRGVIAAIRRKGTSQRKEKIADLSKMYETVGCLF
jgi:hypothetical protein